MQASTRSTLSKYWEEARRYKLSGAILILAVIGAAAASALTPLFVKDLFNAIVNKSSAGSALRVLFIIALLEFTQWSFWRVATFINNYVQAAIMADLGDQCFRYLHKHSFAFFNSNFVGSLVKRVNYFTRAFEPIADRLIWNIIPLIVNFSVIMTVLFHTNVLLGIVILIWVLVFMTINWIFTSYKLKYDLERSDTETKATGLLADTITNQSNLKLFVGYGREVSRFGVANEKVRRLRRFTWNLNSWFEAMQGLLTVSLNLGIFYLAIRLSQEGKITVGDFVLLQTYLIMIFDRVWDFGRIIRDIYSNLADANEMTIMLDTPHEITDAPGAVDLKITAGIIEFKNVDFYYHSTRKIFANLNFKIDKKEKVAFVGPSGAGKSTVVKLLLRMHDVTKGEIIIDGQNINRVTQESLWRAVSLVPQDPILFHRSLMENIRYGKPTATDAEVMAAAKLAHCHEFISEFPEQYNTYVGERGVKLSGGERQRVAIARAVLRNAPILVLDEATSSLDSESEHLIQDALEKLMANKTVIVIAHRLSTIMKMDRIIVVDKGAILESGTHQELLKKDNGLYRELWQLQAGGFITDAVSDSSEAEGVGKPDFEESDL